MPVKQDEEIDRLEEDIRKLKNKYDQFFSGFQKVPPMMDRKNVEISIYEIGKQKMRDNARRFRYNTLLSRYNQYREMWGRKMREREEGPLDFRRRAAALAEPSTPPPAETPAASAPRVTSSNGESYVKVAPGTNGDEVRKLYDQLQQEHSKLGKSSPISLEQLTDMVAKQSEVVRSRYNVSAVAFRVETVDGKVKLKAKPLQE
jgi:polyhydroxyalkanoate synthesis regulator phasin